MITPELITELIRQNMRQYQLVYRLEQLGMEMDNHYLDLCSIVAQLLGLPRQQIPDSFVNLYCRFLDEAGPLPLTGTGEYLEPLARRCFHTLKTSIE